MLKSILTVFLCLQGAILSHAQFSVDPSIEGIFGQIKGFSADFTCVMDGKSIVIKGKMSMSGTHTRAETSMSTGDPKRDAGMLRMGMSHVIAISDIGSPTTIVEYPDKSSYIVSKTPNPSREKFAGAKPVITKIASENIDGHPCDKCNVVTTAKDGSTYQCTIWLATDLKKFPLKCVVKSTTITFSNIDLSMPDAALFQEPTGLTKYDSMQEFIMSSMRPH